MNIFVAGSLTDDGGSFKSMPVGPVAGGIMGCFLLIALGVYCYRHHVHRYSRRYQSSLPDGQGHLRDSTNDNEFDDLDDAHNGSLSFLFIFSFIFYLFIDLP